MTKNKRFEYNYVEGAKGDYIYDVNDNRMMWELDCICELLNTLHDEKEQLKSENEQLRNEMKQILNDDGFVCEWLRNNTVWEQMPSSKRTVTKSISIENNNSDAK